MDPEKDTDDSEKDRGKIENIKSFYLLGTVGIQVVISILIGFAAGLSLDRWLGTEPWFMILFILFGVVAGFLNLYKVAIK